MAEWRSWRSRASPGTVDRDRPPAACPECGKPLVQGGTDLYGCKACGVYYEYTDGAWRRERLEAGTAGGGELIDLQSRIVRQIVAWREQGQTCREIAERLEIPEYRVHYVMRITGNAGRWRGKPRNPKRRQTGRRGTRLAGIVDRYGSVYVESGSWAGYIATIGDTHTGVECMTIDEAIDSAIDAAKGDV